MLSFTRKTDYALVALATLADQNATADDPISANRIAKTYKLPPNVLIKVLKTLQRSGLVASTRGAHGGYYLARSPAWITLADVIATMEGKTELTPCCCETETQAESEKCVACQIMPNCPIGDRMKQLNERIHSFFQQITVKDLIGSELKPNSTVVTVERGSEKEDVVEISAN